MPHLIIDTIPITVPEGTSVLEAARTVGISIPHFCWHPALGKAGACRVCAVKLLDGPVKGIQMSCMLPAQDGMVVSTSDEEAVAMRRQVIEWLMINHPHDCPVCDEGGECLLQEFTIAGNHGIRRYAGKKRTHVNQHLGPHIEHEMNRCIQCYRCARFYQEVAGGTDFGVMGSAGRVYFGRFADGPLESPFAGNLVDICPTGVFTDKTARFRGRYWDYDMAPSICPHCSLGCNTIPAARYRELLKITARRNDQVNGWFICDKGRFGDNGVNDPARPRTPLVDGRETTWDEAIDDLLLRIGEQQALYGPESIALLGSSRLTLEGNLLLARLAEILGCRICYFTGADEQQRTVAAVSLLADDRAASLHDVARADCIAIAGCNLPNDGPMMALAVRQAWRNGARIYLTPSPAIEGGRDGGEPLPFQYTRIDSPEKAPFRDAQRPVIVAAAMTADLESVARLAGTGARPALLFPGPNSVAAALLARERNSMSLEEVVACGTIKGVIAFEPHTPGNPAGSLPLLAIADRYLSAASSRVGVFLPTTAWVEMDGTFVNNEGRAQRFRKVMHPGLPLKGLSPELHPPRTHRKTAPGSDVRSSARIISDLMERTGGDASVDPFTGRWSLLRELDPEGEGMRITVE